MGKVKNQTATDDKRLLTLGKKRKEKEKTLWKKTQDLVTKQDKAPADKARLLQG